MTDCTNCTVKAKLEYLYMEAAVEVIYCFLKSRWRDGCSTMYVVTDSGSE